MYGGLNNEKQERTAGGPGEGSNPVGLNERPFNFRVKAMTEFSVAGNLEGKRADPYDDEEDHAGDGCWDGVAEGPMNLQEHFEDHDGAYDDAHAAGVVLMMGLKRTVGGWGEGWIVNDLYEPDNPGHVS